METLTRRSIVALTLSLAVVNLQAETTQTKKKAPSKSAKTTGSAKVSAPKPEVAFKETVTKLPVGFSGNSVEWVLRNRTLRPKGDFESSAEFSQRSEGFRADLYAFVPDFSEPAFDYDPDTETFSAEIKASITRANSSAGSFRAYNVHGTTLSVSSFVGSNGYGAKSVIKRTKLKLTQIIVDRSEEFGRDSFRSIDLAFKVPRERARQAKRHLKVAFVCTPKAEQFAPQPDSVVKGATGNHVEAATIDSPLELWLYFVPLRVDLRQVWVFDKSTGDVLGRFQPDGQQLDAAPAVAN